MRSTDTAWRVCCAVRRVRAQSNVERNDAATVSVSRNGLPFNCGDAACSSTDTVVSRSTGPAAAAATTAASAAAAGLSDSLTYRVTQKI